MGTNTLGKPIDHKLSQRRLFVDSLFERLARCIPPRALPDGRETANSEGSSRDLLHVYRSLLVSMLSVHRHAWPFHAHPPYVLAHLLPI